VDASEYGLLIPSKVFLTRGVGVARRKLTSFEFALREAGIERCNLVRVSSIFPPHCELLDRDQGIERIHSGAITFCVVAEIATDEPGRLVASSIGLALPHDPTRYGYLSEHEGYGETAAQSGAMAEDLAAGMLASTLGYEFEDAEWDERRRALEIEGAQYRTMNITAAAAGDDEGRWTTTVAAAVFVAFRGD
jgi:arginine decarboxylase